MAAVIERRITRQQSTSTIGVEVQSGTESEAAFSSSSPFMQMLTSSADPDNMDGEIDQLNYEDHGSGVDSECPEVGSTDDAPRLPQLDLSKLSPRELYNTVFCNATINGGYIARSLLKDIMKRVEWKSGFTLAKTKPDKQKQCDELIKVCLDDQFKADAYKFVEEYMFQHENYWKDHYVIVRSYTEAPLPHEDMDTNNDVQLTPSNLRARVATLAVNAKPKEILIKIYGGLKSRSSLDDKSQRFPALWQDLADIFNSSEYVPIVHGVTDTRCNTVDCSQPPATPWAPEKLRSIWNAIRTKYTVTHDNYHRSGLMTEGEDHAEGDDEFFSKFSSEDEVMLFIHLLWGREPPSFCSRLLSAHQQCEEGMGDTPSHTQPPSTGGSSSGGKKRGIEGVIEQASKLLKETLTPLVGGSMQISLDETAQEKNRTMVSLMLSQQKLADAETNRVESAATREKITFLQGMLKDENLTNELKNQICSSIGTLTQQLLPIL